MHRPADHPVVAQPKVGVLLVNLGTPDAPTAEAVKRYLKQFLSDRRVVEIPPLVWQPILRAIVLNTRPQQSAKAYAKVWTDKGSPLAFFTIAQAEALSARTQGWSQTVQDVPCGALPKNGVRPQIRTLPAYLDDAVYIVSVKASVEASLAKLDFVPDALVISFHGMPERTLYLGDPYHCHCQKTARLLSEAMGRELVVSFQSRFGRAKWLRPDTDDTIPRLAQEGKTKIAIFAPGFSVDCLETLEELAIQGHEQFEEAGGTHFAYLPCLNDSQVGMDMLESLIRRELSGWI